MEVRNSDPPCAITAEPGSHIARGVWVLSTQNLDPCSALPNIVDSLRTSLRLGSLVPPRSLARLRLINTSVSFSAGEKYVDSAAAEAWAAAFHTALERYISENHVAAGEAP